MPFGGGLDNLRDDRNTIHLAKQIERNNQLAHLGMRIASRQEDTKIYGLHYMPLLQLNRQSCPRTYPLGLTFTRNAKQHDAHPVAATTDQRAVFQP